VEAAAATPAGRHIVLVGLMGSGKTAVGEELAARCGRPFVDNDRLLERRTGAAAVEVAASSGPDALHAAELDVLQGALSAGEDAVIGAAASVVDAPSIGRLLEPHVVVWLTADPATLAERVRDPEHRPFLEDDPEATLRRQAEARSPRFAAVADIVVDTTDLTPAAVVDRIVAVLP
jgi:shikimate kinase